MVTHQLQVERRTGKVRRPETDVLPLSHATNDDVQVVGRLAAGSDGGDGGERAGGLLARAVQGTEAARHQATQGQGRRLGGQQVADLQPNWTGKITATEDRK